MAKLSDKNFFTASLQGIEDLTNYVFQAMRIEADLEKKYNVGLVLGCKNYDIMSKRADEAIKIYQNGNFDYIIVTGGIGYFSHNRDESEGRIMARYMVEHGINPNNIGIEDKSRDTLQNMKNSLKLIEKVCGEKGSIILFTSDFHQKRSKGILENLTTCPICSYGVEDGKTDIDKWHTNKEGRSYVKNEARLMPILISSDKMKDQVIEPINVKIRK